MSLVTRLCFPSENIKTFLWRLTFVKDQFQFINSLRRYKLVFPVKYIKNPPHTSFSFSGAVVQYFNTRCGYICTLSKSFTALLKNRKKIADVIYLFEKHLEREEKLFNMFLFFG